MQGITLTKARLCISGRARVEHGNRATYMIDRTHRIGQTKNVFVYKMICKDSIEENYRNTTT